jgi:FMN phosphatase YigB (HAD superfamily)
LPEPGEPAASREAWQAVDMTPFRAVLFDFAGTVMMPLDAPTWVAQAAIRTGVALSRDEIAALAQRYLEAGLPGGPYPDDVPDDVAQMYAVRDLGPDEHRAAYTALLSTVPEPAPGFTRAMYEQVLGPEGWVAYPDAAPTVRALQDAGLRVGLISNIGYELRPILEAHDLGALARRCTLSCEHRIMKPDVRLFEAALAQLETEPAQTLMVGDHPSADNGGVALGMRTLLLPMTAPGAAHGLGAVLRLVGA